MIVIPAIDIRGGRCVMLAQGAPDNETIYSDDPIEVADFFYNEGAKRLHIVDLDAALSRDDDQKTRMNREIILALRRKVKNLPIEIGGGIRTASRARELLDEGFDYAIMGTAIVRKPDEFRLAARLNPSRIMAACDINSSGEVMINGWVERTRLTIEDVLGICSRVEGIRKTIIVTDVSSDGMLSGINGNFYKKLSLLFVRYGFKIIASGGVGSIEDIRVLKSVNESIKKEYSLDDNNGGEIIEGVIVGKALYEKKFTLKEAIDAASM